MRLAALGIAGLWLACAIAAAQSPGRARVSGRVLAKDGTPWAGATVTLLAHPMRGRPDVGEPDRVVVTSDEQGRFAAEVLPRLVYSAWAEAASDKTRRVSFLQTDVIAPSSVRLTESSIPPPRRRLDPEKSWQEAEVRVVDAASQPIAGAVLWCRTERALPAPLPGEGEAMPRWSRIGIHVIDETWVRAGVTDAEGKARIRRSRRSPEIVVEASGFALGYQNGVQPEPIVLVAAKGVRGRLLQAGEPLAGVTLVADYQPTVSAGKARQHFRFAPPPVETAADGTFAISGPLDETTVRLDALLPEALCRRLWPQLDFVPVPQAWIATIDKTDGARPGDLDLAKLAPLAIDVIQADGSPCPTADVLIRSSAGAVNGPRLRPIALVTDRRGRACVVLPSGSYQVLAVAAEAGWVCETFEVGKAGPPLRLALAALREVRVKVVDANGAAVPDARLQSSGGGYTHVGTMFEEAFAWNRLAITGRTDATGICVVRIMPWPQQELSIQATGGRVASAARLSAATAPEELEIVIAK